MFKNKTKNLLVGVATVSMLLVGCADSTSDSKTKKMTAEQEETFINELLGQENMNSMNPSLFEEEMEKELGKMSDAGAAEVVDGYIFTIYKNLSTYSSKVQGFNVELLALKEAGTNFNKKADRDAIKNELLRTFVQEVYNNQLKLSETGGVYNVYPDLAHVIKEYGSYMTEDMKTYITLSNEEMNQSFFNAETGEIDLSIVSDRIVRLGEMISKYPDSPYQLSFANSISYYYEVYFGTNNELLEDSDNLLKASVWEQYKKDAETFKDTALGADLAVLLPVIEKNKGQMNPDVLEVVGNIVQSKSPQQPETSSEETVTEEVELTEEEVLKNVEKAKETIKESSSK